MNRLHIPTGVSLHLELSFDGKESLLLDYLPGRSPKLGNLVYITTVNLFHWDDGSYD